MRTVTLRAAMAIGGFLWVVAVGAGFSLLWQYAYTPGQAATVTKRWPSTTMAHDRSRFTLVMVVHPECSCSDASIAELARIVAAAPAMTATVLFDMPSGKPVSPMSNRLWRAARAIPGVTPMLDPNGSEAAKFGAAVSGQTYLYDPSGVLQFSGGITSARGHAGDNDGETAIDLLVAGGVAPLAETPVFGCDLSKAVRR